MAKKKTVKVGLTYLHPYDGKMWTVKITNIDRTDPKRLEFDAVLQTNQHHLQAGDRVWGLVSELMTGTRDGKGLTKAHEI